MFRTKKIALEIEKIIEQNQLDRINFNFNNFNNKLLELNSLDIISRYFNSTWTDPINRTSTLSIDRLKFPEPLIFNESNIDLNSLSFVRSVFGNKKPVYEFKFHDVVFPKPDECIYKSEQNGTHLIKVKNGIVSIPPELLTKKFSISYIAGGRTLGKSHSSSFKLSPKIINPMLD